MDVKENYYNDFKRIIETRKKLIDAIWSYCKRSHNEKDFKDLQTFTIEDLEEILTNLKKK